MESSEFGIVPLLAHEAFRDAFALQVQTQRGFHAIAARVAGEDCPLGGLRPEAVAIERNFFSTLFLGVTRLLTGPGRYLPLYAMVNQGMRAWVTACDNILDDEYKEIFPFVSAGRGDRMRSVLTLLLADRVVGEFILDRYGREDHGEVLRRVGRVSLAALLSSAVQESEEETRPVPVLPPRRILADVHMRKTGDLFVAPLALPTAMEPLPPDRARRARQMLRQFGLACQVLDDIKDMPADVASGRHNLLVSLVAHRDGGARTVEALRREPPGSWQPWGRFPAACRQAWQTARLRFEEAFDHLEALGMPPGSIPRESLIEWMALLLRVPVPSGRGAMGTTA